MPLIRRGNPRGLSINRSHPACINLGLLAVADGAATMIDLTRRNGPGAATAGTPTAAYDQYIGKGMAVPKSAGFGWTANAIGAGSYNQVTYAILFKQVTPPLAAGNFFGDTGTVTTGSGLEYSSTPRFRIRMNSNSLVLNPGATPVTGGIYFIAGSAGPGGSNIIGRRFESPGRGSSAFDASQSGTANTSASGSGFYKFVTSSASSADIAFGLISYDFLSLKQMILWARDPWSIFQRSNDAPLFSAAASSNTLPMMGVG